MFINLLRLFGKKTSKKPASKTNQLGKQQKPAKPVPSNLTRHRFVQRP
jgi:hypothetical protein